MVKNEFVPRARNLVYGVYLEKKPASVQLGDKKLEAFDVSGGKDRMHASMTQAEWGWDVEMRTCVVRSPAVAVGEKLFIEK